MANGIHESTQVKLDAMESLIQLTKNIRTFESCEPAPETEYDEMILRLKGYEPSLVKFYWIRYK